VVDCWQKQGVAGEQAYIAEARSVADLQENATAKNLVRVFFIQDRLKALAKNVPFAAKQVHVIGAGTMGGDIAAWAALKGFQVTLQDPDLNMIAKTMARAYKLFKKKLKDRLLIQAALDRLSADPAGLGVAQADVIIEAVFENLTVKQDIFKSLEQRAKPSAILATNTSSIPLDEINQVMQHPERLVGIHFFNPVAKMMLVEVVRGARTDDGVFNGALAFVHKIGKLALPVKSSPGFLVNRVLMPYLMEALALLQDGFSKEAIDAAAVQFGMPLGPIQLADAVGLDICLSVARNLTQHFGGVVPEQLIEMVAAKKLGVKSGQGFYQYKQGKPVKQKSASTISTAEQNLIIERLIYRMLNEAAACLREQVVSDGDLVDAGMIFGAGFAPFRGGPIHYAQFIGKEKLLENFSKLQGMYGARFTSDAGWNDIV
jgi:3-hydroxyacyl-CoA dehydrogenase/enoyl-CoA hydratase/3-hydroxybutyryl-CoA epimerase